jgi:hypothetical protein
MTRLPGLLLALLLAASTTPAAAASVPPPVETGLFPPDSPAVAPAVAPVAAFSSLRRLGTLRIPGIGLAVNVYDWGCGNSIVPNLALRWGCKASNNRFIAGHGYGVFHPYLVAYSRRRLVPGLIATFTDPSGRTTRYRLAWSRLVPKTFLWKGQTGDQWAWGDTPGPTLTLQSCWGSTNAYRIITRFVRA